MKKIFHTFISLRLMWKLILIFSLAFIIRLAMNIVFQGLDSPPDPDMGSDHIEYDLLAQGLALGKGFVLKSHTPITHRPPGVPFLLFPIYYLLGVNYAIARILFCLLGAATCIITYLIGSKIFNKSFGILASLILCLYPMHFYYSSHLFSEVPWALFMSLAIYCAIFWEDKGKIFYGVAMGLLLGISACIRPTALFYPACYALLCLIFYFKEQRKCIKLITVPLTFMIITISPWIIRNYMITNHITLISTHGGSTFWGAHNEKILNDPEKIGGWITSIGLPERQDFDKIKGAYNRDKTAYKYGLMFIRRHWHDMPKLELMKIYRLITPFYNTPNRAFNIVGGGSWGLLIPFVFIGIILTYKNRTFLSLHSSLLLTILITIIFYGSHRFRASISPFLAIYACAGCFWIKAFINKTILRT